MREEVLDLVFCISFYGLKLRSIPFVARVGAEEAEFCADGYCVFEFGL